MKCINTRHSPGEVTLPYELFYEAWDECIELQVQPRLEWMQKVIGSLTQSYRTEVKYYVDGVVVGGAVLAPETNDPHVGHCMYVVFQYVLREYRNTGIARGIFKQLIQEAKLFGCPVVAYTHRLGDWTYKTTYKVIHG